MKNIKLIVLLVNCILYTVSLKAQYYKVSRKNKCLLLSNAYSLSEIPLLTNSVEFGRQYSRLIFHGGAAVSNSILKNATSDVIQTNYIKTPVYNGLFGLDLNLFNFPILNLSQRTYCKYFVGALNIGFDTFKNLQTSLANNYGYRAKVYLSLSILRTGSYKKDIGYRRYMQLGYCYTDNNISSNNTTYNSLMLNFFIAKQRLIKFADWY
jgi:hypothetical protein